MDLDGEGSLDPCGSSIFDPNAPEFLPGEASIDSQDVSLGSLSGSLTGDGAPQGGASLVFGGGGEFLSKYRGMQRSRDGSSAAESVSAMSGMPSRDASTEAGGSAGPRLRNSRRPGANVSREAGSADSSTKVSPAPDRVNVQLNSLLVHARTVDKILQVVDAHFNHFNAVNMITALHRLATVVVAARKGALRREPRFKKLIHRLSETLRNADAGALKPQDLSNVAWALTKLGLLNAVLFGHLSEHIMRTIRHFEPVNLSMTLWAFARSGFLDEKLFHASKSEVKRQLPDFQPQQIANTTWAMAKSGFVDEELFIAAANLALKKLGEFQPMNYSMLLYSFALAKLPHPKLFEEVGKRCTVQALSSAISAPHVVTNLALAFSEAGVVNPAVFDTIARVASGALNDFRTQQITTLAQAFARAEVKHEKFFSCVSGAVVQRLGEFKQQDLQDLLASYERLGVSTADIAHAIESQQSQEADSGMNFWSVLTAVAFVLLVTLVAWRIKTGNTGPAIAGDAGAGRG